MTGFIKFLSLIITGALLTTCASAPEISSNSTHLEMAKRLEQMVEEGNSRVKLVLSKTSGTSVYMIVSLCRNTECSGENDYELLGAILPENSSTRVTGEIFSYNLARVFGLDRYYGPGVHFLLKGEGFKQFRRMITDARYKGQKEDNRKILIDLTSSTNSLNCAYKWWGPKPYDLDKIISDNMPVSGAPLLMFIRAESPKPADEAINLREISSCRADAVGRASELARQLSGIFLIDMLTGQWDRFSGGNLQATINNGELMLASFDNGGTFSYHPTSRWFERYKSIVSRFDRQVSERIFQMNRFLNMEKGETFLNFNSEMEFREEMGVVRGSDNLVNADWIWENFKKNLSKLVEYIRSLEVKYGERCYF